MKYGNLNLTKSFSYQLIFMSTLLFYYNKSKIILDNAQQSDKSLGCLDSLVRTYEAISLKSMDSMIVVAKRDNKRKA